MFLYTLKTKTPPQEDVSGGGAFGCVSGAAAYAFHKPCRLQ